MKKILLAAIISMSAEAARDKYPNFGAINQS